jgi:hypothetical protein
MQKANGSIAKRFRIIVSRKVLYDNGELGILGCIDGRGNFFRGLFKKNRLTIEN